MIRRRMLLMCLAAIIGLFLIKRFMMDNEPHHKTTKKKGLYNLMEEMPNMSKHVKDCTIGKFDNVCDLNYKAHSISDCIKSMQMNTNCSKIIRVCWILFGVSISTNHHLLTCHSTWTTRTSKISPLVK